MNEFKRIIIEQNEKIKSLTEENKKLKMQVKSENLTDEDTARILDENRVLKNRCFVMSKGALCIFCKMECEHE